MNELNPMLRNGKHNCPGVKVPATPLHSQMLTEVRWLLKGKAENDSSQHREAFRPSLQMNYRRDSSQRNRRPAAVTVDEGLGGKGELERGVSASPHTKDKQGGRYKGRVRTTH